MNVFTTQINICQSRSFFKNIENEQYLKNIYVVFFSAKIFNIVEKKNQIDFDIFFAKINSKTSSSNLFFITRKLLKFHLKNELSTDENKFLFKEDLGLERRKDFSETISLNDKFYHNNSILEAKKLEIKRKKEIFLHVLTKFIKTNIKDRTRSTEWYSNFLGKINENFSFNLLDSNNIAKFKFTFSVDNIVTNSIGLSLKINFSIYEIYMYCFMNFYLCKEHCVDIKQNKKLLTENNFEKFKSNLKENLLNNHNNILDLFKKFEEIKYEISEILIHKMKDIELFQILSIYFIFYFPDYHEEKNKFISLSILLIKKIYLKYILEIYLYIFGDKDILRMRIIKKNKMDIKIYKIN